VCCRARTPKYFQVRANMMIKNLLKILLLRPKTTAPNFFQICCFLLVFVAATKKCCQNVCSTIKKTFLFRKFFSKSLSNVSSGTGGTNFGMDYVSASYMTCSVPVSFCFLV